MTAERKTQMRRWSPESDPRKHQKTLWRPMDSFSRGPVQHATACSSPHGDAAGLLLEIDMKAQERDVMSPHHRTALRATSPWEMTVLVRIVLQAKPQRNNFPPRSRQDAIDTTTSSISPHTFVISESFNLPTKWAWSTSTKANASRLCPQTRWQDPFAATTAWPLTKRRRENIQNIRRSLSPWACFG